MTFEKKLLDLLGVNIEFTTSNTIDSWGKGDVRIPCEYACMWVIAKGNPELAKKLEEMLDHSKTATGHRATIEGSDGYIYMIADIPIAGCINPISGTYADPELVRCLVRSKNGSVIHTISGYHDFLVRPEEED